MAIAVRASPESSGHYAPVGTQHRLRVLLSLALVAVALTGCAAGPRRAVVSGHFVRYGGPPSAPRLLLSGTVTATRADGTTTSTAVHDDGFFRLSLRPGEYSLVGKSQGLGTCPSIYDGIAQTLTEKITVTTEDRTVDVWCVID